MNSKIRALLPLLSGLVASACIDVKDKGRDWPAAPAGATAVIHVAVDAEEGGDGSAIAPYGSLQDAIDAAPAGAAVLLTHGDYTEPIVVGRSVTMRALPGVTLGNAPFDVTVRVDGAGTEARFEDIRFTEGTAAVALVRAAHATFVRCTLQGSPSPLSAGFGIVASDGAHLELHDTVVRQNEASGVAAIGARVTIVGGTIEDNVQGGVLIESGVGTSLLDQVQVSTNDRFGVAVISSSAWIARSTLAETRSLGDGVLVSVAEGGVASEVHLGGPVACQAVGLEGGSCGNDIRHNQRFGVFWQLGAGTVAGNAIDDNAGGGLWLQGSGGELPLAIEDNVLADNGLVGIAVSAGGMADILGNSVDHTLAVTVGAGSDFGDGIAVLDGAVSTIDGNTVRGSQRAGIFLDHAGAGTWVGDNVLEDNAVAPVLVQGGLDGLGVTMGGGVGSPEDGEGSEAPRPGTESDTEPAASAAPTDDTSDWVEDDEASSYGSYDTSDTSKATKGATALLDGEEDSEDEEEEEGSAGDE